MHIHNHPIKKEYQQGIQKVLHYISQNLSGDLSLETLASIANYSPFHFQKIFSEAVTESPKQYVMRLRLERAAHYLKVFSDLPVIEIAIGCGFSSPSIFSRAFKNYYGASAEEFRKMSIIEISAISNKLSKNRQFEFEGSDSWLSLSNPKEIPTTIQISPLIKVINISKIACIQTTLRLFNK